MTVTAKVQIDETGHTFGTTFSGTDVSSSAIAGLSYSPITVTWGRQDQYAQVTPTSVDGMFANKTGTFTPGNAGAGSWLKRGMRRRVIITANATDVNISEDYASSLEAVPTPDLWTTSVGGADILARLGGTASSDVNSAVIGTTMRSFLAEEILLDSPSALYMLQEPEGSTSFGDVTGVNATGSIGNSKLGPGAVTAGQSVDGNYVAGTAVQVANPAPLIAQQPGSYLSFPTFASSFEFWTTLPTSAPAHDSTILSMYAADSSGVLLNAAAPLGALNLFVFGTSSRVITGSVLPLDGKMHHFYVTVAADNSSAKVYLDGVLAGTDTGTAFTRPVPQSTQLGAAVSTYVGPGVVDQDFSGSFAYLAFYNADIGATRVLAHYNAGANAFNGETTDVRITRLLSYRTDTGSVTETGLNQIGFQDIQGRSLTDCLLEIGQVEGGTVFVDGQGRVNFRSLSRILNPAVDATLNCSTGAVDFGSNIREDTQNVLNDVTATATNGADQRYYDATSISNDGEYSTSVQLPFASDADALYTASWMVNNGTQRQITITPILVNLLTCPAASALAVLQLQPLDCIQLTNIDVNATRAPSTTMTFIVQGGEITYGVDSAQASLNVTPLPLAVVTIGGDSAHGIASVAVVAPY